MNLDNLDGSTTVPKLNMSTAEFESLSSIEQYKKLLDLKDELISKQTELIFKEKEISDREVELTKLVSYSNSGEVNTLKDCVNPFEVNEGSTEFNSSDMLIYELLFKKLKRLDTITVPFKVFKELRVVLKKTISSNSNFSIYEGVAVVKMNTWSTFDMLCVIDINNEDDVRLTVLKPFSQSCDCSGVINKLLEHYNKWKSNRNYIR